MAERTMKMNELINVTMNDNNVQTVSARELHNALEIKQRFSVWFDTNSKYFIEGTDFTTVKTDTEVSNNGGIQLRSLQDYQLTLDMGKQVAMMSRTEKGKQVRAAQKSINWTIFIQLLRQHLRYDCDYKN